MKLAATAIALVFLAVLALTTHADEIDSTTLRRIRDTGTIVIGVREAAVPFSYYDENQQVIGYSQAFALRIVDAVRDALNLPKLKVRQVVITPQNRIPLVQNGTIDMECSTTAHTLARESQVAFSDSIFAYGVRMITKPGSPVKDFSDLAGRTVVTTAGTSEERMLRQWNAAHTMNMHVIVAKSHADSFSLVKSGRAAAFVMDEPLLYGSRAVDPDARDYPVVGTPPVLEAYACMFRRGDPDFKRLVDNAIAKMQRSGDAAALYHRWFEEPVPPHGVNLEYPMSAQMKALFANPNDRALD